MMKEGHGPTKSLQYLNWGAFDYASHAPQLRSSNYYIQIIFTLYIVSTAGVDL